MEITVQGIVDETPQGLSTGFRVVLDCEADGKTFKLDLPILVSPEMVRKGIDLNKVAVAYLEAKGLDDWPDLFVDSRKLDLDKLPAAPQAFPLNVKLGGHDILAQKAIEKLAK